MSIRYVTACHRQARRQHWVRAPGRARYERTDGWVLTLVAAGSWVLISPRGIAITTLLVVNGQEAHRVAQLSAEAAILAFEARAALRNAG